MTAIGCYGQLVPGALSINVWNDGEHLYVDAYRLYLDMPAHLPLATRDQSVVRHWHEDTGTTAGSRKRPCAQEDRVFDHWADADATGLWGWEELVKQNPALTHDDREFIRTSVSELTAQLCQPVSRARRGL